MISPGNTNSSVALLYRTKRSLMIYPRTLYATKGPGLRNRDVAAWRTTYGSSEA